MARALRRERISLPSNTASSSRFPESTGASSRFVGRSIRGRDIASPPLCGGNRSPYHEIYNAKFHENSYPRFQGPASLASCLMTLKGSVVSTKRTSISTLNMSAFGGKADISDRLAYVH